MTLLLSLLPLLAQIGPYTPPSVGPGPKLPPAAERPAPRRPAPMVTALPPPASTKGAACRDALASDAVAAQEYARDGLGSVKGAELAELQACLGLASSRRDEWDVAGTAFLAARDASGTDQLSRARYGTMAGNAALAGKQAERAITALNQARDDAKGLDDNVLSGEIAVDRARAFVALQRLYDARIALDDALAINPASSDAWLYSATLARRMAKLPLAQQHIEKAAEINPVEPAIGLEAGVIAVLSGRDDTARKSWNSVIAAAPDSAEAAQAKGYLAQLDGGTATTAK